MEFGITLVLWIWLLPVMAVARVVPVLELVEDKQNRHPCWRFTANQLIHLDCSNRHLKELPEDVGNFDAQVLLLTNNEFEVYPIQLRNYHQMKILDLSGNRLNEPLPLFMRELTNLEKIDLSNNLFDTWSSNNQYVTVNIKTLNLSSNKIDKITRDAFDSMPHLHSLDLSQNFINELPDSLFDNLKNLVELNLSENRYITQVPNFTSSSLRTLNLSNCGILVLKAESLAEFHSILHLDLSSNHIQELPESLRSNTLQELYLRNNEINSINDVTFSSLPHLAVLDLRNNDFTTVWSTSHFASNLFLREVRVSGNRWNCNDFSVNLLVTYEYLTKYPSKVEDVGSLICYIPSNVTRMSWQEAYIRTWHESTTSAGSFTLIAIMIGFVVGILITSFVCRALASMNRGDEPPNRSVPEVTIVNLNGTVTQPRVDSIVMRREEDSPPSYDDALLMPRLNSSFHSLPDYVDMARDTRIDRRSRSIGDITESGLRTSDRRSVRPYINSVNTHQTVSIEQ